MQFWYLWCLSPFGICEPFLFIFLLKTTQPMENRGPPDGSRGEAAAAQPTSGLGVSTAETPSRVGKERGMWKISW